MQSPSDIGVTEIVNLLFMQFCNACKYGMMDRIERLLQDPYVDPSADNNRALLLAITNNQAEVVERLLQDIRVIATQTISPYKNT